MPLGGLRSRIDGTFFANSEFPDPDNLPRRNQAIMADDENTSQYSNLNTASVSSTSASANIIWSENPAFGTFNPGTKEGALIFKLKTKNEHHEKIELTKKNAPLFWRLFLAKEPSFGKIISKIPVNFDAVGKAIKHENLIQEYTSIEMKTIQRNAITRFSTRLNQGNSIPDPPFEKRALDPANDEDNRTIFYERVDSQVVATWIQATFTTTSYANFS